ncbi:hypothetical protein [Haloarchaeobius sp. HRN-SO-5]|uniref:hypothetical protein n=1 Tax=Haloarchaeobius sp. HRN-SO-5 TaxID=3446118 RepID=UPI003EBFE09B
MPEFEFGSRLNAKAFRNDHEDHLCPDDDKRQKTVTLVSDAPERVLTQAAIQSASSRGDRGSRGGQIELTDHEKRELDFTRTNVPHARSVKGIAAEAGVDDWLAFYDHTLTVDEHRERMADAKRDEVGDRLDAEKTADERLAEVEGALRKQCDHGVEVCQNGDPEACEFLQEECGFSEDEVAMFLDDRPDAGEQQQLVTVGGGEFPELDVTPQEAGALHRSWQGYKGAVSRLDRELSDVREAVVHARGAMRAINAIRNRHGQDALHPDRLHDLLEALDRLPGAIPEVRTLEHFTESGVTGGVIEHDEQRDLSGDRADDQTRFSGQDRRDVDPEVVEHVQENEGGLMADERDVDQRPNPENSEQQIPDEFKVAEGGQNTL